MFTDSLTHTHMYVYVYAKTEKKKEIVKLSISLMFRVNTRKIELRQYLEMYFCWNLMIVINRDKLRPESWIETVIDR